MEMDPIIEEMLDKTPLVAFSVYTDIQSRTLQTLGAEILACFDAGIKPDGASGNGSNCSGELVIRGYGQFWLWVLGAYEVVRTMCPNPEQCDRYFSRGVSDRLKELKRRLAELRMPFAKQELRGKNVPVEAEPSICGIGTSPPDLRFEVEGQVISARELIVEFATVLGNIARGDVLADHRTQYAAHTGARSVPETPNHRTHRSGGS